jgi:formylglycine-generating enzyme required for sulfatase activity/GTPase SAR1 family protein
MMYERDHGGRGSVQSLLAEEGAFVTDVTMKMQHIEKMVQVILINYQGYPKFNKDLAEIRSRYFSYLENRLELPTSSTLTYLMLDQEVGMALEKVYIPCLLVPGAPNYKTLQPPDKLLTGESRDINRQLPTPVSLQEVIKPSQCLVLLGHPGAGKTSLIQSLTLELVKQLKTQDHALMPVVVPLVDYADRLAREAAAVRLGNFLPSYYASLIETGRLIRPEDCFRNLIGGALDSGQALILLDALDEVKAHREWVIRGIKEFAHEYKQRGNTIVVTSRIAGFDPKLFDPSQWRIYTLSRFGREEIKRFINNWFQEYRRQRPRRHGPGLAEEAEQLIQQVFGRRELEDLASVPLLLTIMALIHARQLPLPQRLYELYERYFETLLNEKVRRAVPISNGPISLSNLSLRYDYKVAIKLLSQLALRVQESTLDFFSRGDLEKWLSEFFREQDMYTGDNVKSEARRFIDQACLDSNLIVGDEQYTFLHRAFEEALAGRGIALLANSSQSYDKALKIFANRVADPLWETTLRLAVSYLSGKLENTDTTGRLIRELLGREESGRMVILVGQCLGDIGSQGLTPSRDTVRMIHIRLEAVMRNSSGEYMISERRDAGLILSDQGWNFAFDQFARVEKSKHPRAQEYQPVPGVYEVGVYPVTNREFQRFVDAKAYHERRWWSQEGWDWLRNPSDSEFIQIMDDWCQKRVWIRLNTIGPKEPITSPFFWFGLDWNRDLLPVVGVTYCEAEAYCKWLTDHLRSKQLLEEGWIIRLPTALEWELAAAPFDRAAKYPWKGPLSYHNANVTIREDGIETGLKATTPVCMYPSGQSWCGACDMIGNVWEWTSTLYSSTHLSPREPTLYRAVRGGAWNVASNFVVEQLSYNFNYGYPIYYSDNFIGFRVVRAKER